MLYFVGLGLGDAKDITVRGLEIVKRCEKVGTWWILVPLPDQVYLEHYTSILTCGKEELESLYGREVGGAGANICLADPIFRRD